MVRVLTDDDLGRLVDGLVVGLVRGSVGVVRIVVVSSESSSSRLPLRSIGGSVPCVRTLPVNFDVPLVVRAVGRAVEVEVLDALEVDEEVLGLSVGFSVEPAVVGLELEGSLSMVGGVGNDSVVPGEGDEKAVLGVVVSAAVESGILVDSVVSAQVDFSVDDGVTFVGDRVAGDLLNAFVELAVVGLVLVVDSGVLVCTNSAVDGSVEVTDEVVECSACLVEGDEVEGSGVDCVGFSVT